jgi:hypothetical protein
MRYLLGSSVVLVAVAVCLLSLGLRLSSVPLFAAGRIMLAVALGAACLPVLTVLVVKCLARISRS